MSPHPRRLFLGLVLFVLTACAPSAAPRLIGAAPRSSAPAAPIVYTGYLTLAAADVDAAADRAARLAESYSGYLVEAHTWTAGDGRRATVTLAVPVPNFDALRQALLGLGTFVEETVSSQPRPIGRDDWNTYTQIVLTLQPAAAAWNPPPLPDTGWDPARTLSRAFGVSAAILGFLADLVIWVIVVAGPLVLLGWGAWALWRRGRR